VRFLQIPRRRLAECECLGFQLLLLAVFCAYVLSFETQWRKKGEPELIVETLWDFTVLKFLKRMSWLPAEPEVGGGTGENAQDGTERMQGGENGHSAPAEEQVIPPVIVDDEPGEPDK
jgi:hypothetical protein